MRSHYPFFYLYSLINIKMSIESKYSKRGVSSAKEDVHAAIKNIDKGLYPKAFCKIVPDLLGGDKDYLQYYAC